MAGIEQFKPFESYPKKRIPMDKKFLEETYQRELDEINKRSFENFKATGKIAGYIR
jgi:hypothetical protein